MENMNINIRVLWVNSTSCLTSLEFRIFALFRIHLSYMVLTSLLVKTTSHGW